MYSVEYLPERCHLDNSQFKLEYPVTLEWQKNIERPRLVPHSLDDKPPQHDLYMVKSGYHSLPYCWSYSFFFSFTLVSTATLASSSD